VPLGPLTVFVVATALAVASHLVLGECTRKACISGDLVPDQGEFARCRRRSPRCSEPIPSKALRRVGRRVVRLPARSHTHHRGANRPETFASASRVIVLQDGEVAQDQRRVPGGGSSNPRVESSRRVAA